MKDVFSEVGVVVLGGKMWLLVEGVLVGGGFKFVV